MFGSFGACVEQIALMDCHHTSKLLFSGAWSFYNVFLLKVFLILLPADNFLLIFFSVPTFYILISLYSFNILPLRAPRARYLLPAGMACGQWQWSHYRPGELGELDGPRLVLMGSLNVRP